MKRFYCGFPILIVCLMAAVPRLINYQGKLLDSSGVGVNDTVNLVFRLYLSAEGGGVLWEESQEVYVRNGLFSVVLGQGVPFPDSVDFSAQYWLEVEVEGEVMYPRERLVSVPYSMMALEAKRVVRSVATDANPEPRTGRLLLRARDGVTLSDDGDSILVIFTGGGTSADEDWRVVGDDMYALPTRYIGIGTITPEAKLHIFTPYGVSSNMFLENYGGAILKLAGEAVSASVGTANDFPLEILQNNFCRIHIDRGGNVGVSKESPAYRLDVAGGINADSVCIGGTCVRSWGEAGVGGSGGENYIAKWTGTSVIGSSSIYEDSGNVGIGTAEPSARLHIRSDDTLTVPFRIDAKIRALSGWMYRKRVTISGSSGAGTNYQVLLKVGESAGSSGAHFHLEGHSANFPSGTNQGGDLRFTAADGLTQLDFWVEKVEGSAPNRVAYIWVKVLDDLTTNQNIYCYYGNLSTTNASDGNRTFIFFDDFEGSTLDPTKWVPEIGGGSYTVGGSLLNITSPGTGTIMPVIRTLNTFPTNYRSFEARWRINSQSTQSPGVNLRTNLSSGGYLSYFLSSAFSYHDDAYIDTNGDGIYENYVDFLSWTTGVFYRTSNKIKPGLTIWERDGLVYSYGGSFNQNVYILLGHWVVGGVDTRMFNADWDWVFVRKYTNPEPGFLSGGLEEQTESYKSVLSVSSTTGNVAIGTDDPGEYKLYVNGPAFSTGGWTSSDARFKKNLNSIDKPMDIILGINGISFEWDSESFPYKFFPSGRHYGVVAQEIEKILPEIVKIGPDGEKAVSYLELIPILIEAIKEQQREINELKSKLKGEN